MAFFFLLKDVLVLKASRELLVHLEGRGFARPLCVQGLNSQWACQSNDTQVAECGVHGAGEEQPGDFHIAPSLLPPLASLLQMRDSGAIPWDLLFSLFPYCAPVISCD